MAEDSDLTPVPVDLGPPAEPADPVLAARHSRLPPIPPPADSREPDPPELGLPRPSQSFAARQPFHVPTTPLGQPIRMPPRHPFIRPDGFPAGPGRSELDLPMPRVPFRAQSPTPHSPDALPFGWPSMPLGRHAPAYVPPRWTSSVTLDSLAETQRDMMDLLRLILTELRETRARPSDALVSAARDFLSNTRSKKSKRRHNH